MQLLVAGVVLLSSLLLVANGEVVDVHEQAGKETIGTASVAYVPCGTRTGSGRSRRSLEDAGLLRQPRIVKGSEAEVNDLAFMAAILKSDNFKCTGFIIHPQFIMTASAQCIDGLTQTSFVISGLTDYTARTGSRDYKTGDPVTLGTFAGFPANAIPQLLGPLGSWGLFRVDGTNTILNYGTKALPLCLGKGITTDNREAEFAGWGTETKSGSGRAASTRLRKMNAKILQSKNCNFKYGVGKMTSFTKRKILDSVSMCARTTSGLGTVIEGPCEYDYGGPLFLSEGGKWTAVGVFADIGRSDNKCGQWLSPGIYTNVQPYFTDATVAIVRTSDAGGSAADIAAAATTEITKIVATITAAILAVGG